MSIPMVEAPRLDLFDDTNTTLSAAALSYNFANIMDAYRNGEIDLKLPEGFPLKNFDRFKTESICFCEIDQDDDGVPDGLSFSHVANLLKANEEEMKKVSFHHSGWDKELIKGVEEQKERGIDTDQYFLCTYRCIQASVSCVYGVLKCKLTKRIIIAFRGSVSSGTADWQQNLDAPCDDLRTPKLIRDKMEGVLKNRVLVHRGFREYLFDNEHVDGDQRYDRVLNDIKPLIEEGYSIYVTGHSLGGALATMISFKLAGTKKKWLPRPITCISFAAPRSGSQGYRTAFEQLEKDGLLRHIRVNVDTDIVPPIMTMSHFSLTRRLFKHVGINLRLSENGFKVIHSSKDGLINAIRNNFIIPIFYAIYAFCRFSDPGHYHYIKIHYERMIKATNELRTMKIDDLYQDKNVVSKKFHQNRFIPTDEKIGLLATDKRL